MDLSQLEWPTLPVRGATSPPTLSTENVWSRRVASATAATEATHATGAEATEATEATEAIVMKIARLATMCDAATAELRANCKWAKKRNKKARRREAICLEKEHIAASERYAEGAVCRFTCLFSRLFYAHTHAVMLRMLERAVSSEEDRDMPLSPPPAPPVLPTPPPPRYGPSDLYMISS